MTTELDTIQQAQPPALHIANTVASIKANVQMVQHLMRDLMVPDVHYGVIPGTKKPSLYQPGAEIIALAFQWATRYVNEDLSYTEVVRYRVTCELYSRTSGEFVGTGQGEASSDEEKYRWRAAVSKAEFDATPEDRRRQKFYKNGGIGTQVRTEPPDIANTVLKMAAKRSFIAATRTASGCSDMFAQDLEDLPDGVREALIGDEQPKGPPPILGEEGWKKLLAQAEGFGYNAGDVIASAGTLGYEGLAADMPRDLAKQLFRALRDHPQSPPDEDPDAGPDTALSRDAEPEGVSVAAEASADATEAESVADETAAWPLVESVDLSNEPPMTATLAAQYAQAIHTARPATNPDKRRLKEALEHVSEAAWKAHLKSQYGKDRGDLTHDECEAFTAWACALAVT